MIKNNHSGENQAFTLQAKDGKLNFTSVQVCLICLIYLTSWIKHFAVLNEVASYTLSVYRHLRHPTRVRASTKLPAMVCKICNFLFTSRWAFNRGGGL